MSLLSNLLTDRIIEAIGKGIENSDINLQDETYNLLIDIYLIISLNSKYKRVRGLLIDCKKL